MFIFRLFVTLPIRRQSSRLCRKRRSTFLLGMVTMKCPRCHGTLVAEKHQDLTIDQCGACGGIWLDEGELVTILSRTLKDLSKETIAQTIARRFAGIPTHEKESIELCPKCFAKLNPVNYDYNSGVIMDYCPNQHGFWLDHTEIERLGEYKVASALNSSQQLAKIKPKLDEIANTKSGQPTHEGLIIARLTDILYRLVE